MKLVLLFLILLTGIEQYVGVAGCCVHSSWHNFHCPFHNPSLEESDYFFLNKQVHNLEIRLLTLQNEFRELVEKFRKYNKDTNGPSVLENVVSNETKVHTTQSTPTSTILYESIVKSYKKSILSENKDRKDSSTSENIELNKKSNKDTQTKIKDSSIFKNNKSNETKVNGTEIFRWIIEKRRNKNKDLFYDDDYSF
ncbi:uncharacterized protein LOC105428932 [Pogonomyrmex barbatus]|uniref:Uncharacterized protein LOC105428932 n=1 Tax=Pogonomyrmex barbatus TaxID=144034 RepID=A0A6I9WFP3_9HYME|nr:uncharacterized protein LOC105428932 [Pogonomyrmex barbatus]